MRRLLAAFVVVLLALSSAAPASAQLVRGIGNTTTANVTLTTGTETVAVTSNAFVSPRETVQVVVFAWGQLSTGAGTTEVAPRIRRGSTTSGTQIGDTVQEEVKAAAGSDEPFLIIASEERVGGGILEYSFTLQQISATGNGTVTQAGILVFVF